MKTFFIGGIGTAGPYQEEMVELLDQAGFGPTSILNKSFLKGRWRGGVIDMLLQVITTPFFANVSGLFRKSWSALLSKDCQTLIGYSFGGLVAAQAALKRSKTQNLILIATPIGSGLLKKLVQGGSIDQLIIIDLEEFDDPIFAGIPLLKLLLSPIKLTKQYMTCSGHFWYAAGHHRTARIDLVNQISKQCDERAKL